MTKVWPPGERGRRSLGGLVKRRPRRRHRGSADLADWVIREEERLIGTRFGGDAELYRAWRDRLWSEMHDTMRRPEAARRCGDDDEYVVMRAFDGNWAQYRVCRDRLREELWQIMKATRRR